MNNRYVILTGAKNNAGDFLIKYRAKQLLAALRPDRDVIDLDRWKPLTDNQLEMVNASRALIITGGPALQSRMYPDICPLVDDIARIKVPILTMSIGWGGKTGSWEECYDYNLSIRTGELLRRIASSGCFSSVRDYHTLNVLRSHGFENFLVTGCTALYSLDHIGHEMAPSGIPRQVSYSLGVSFYKSRNLSQQNKQMILSLRDAFPHARLSVVFHHATDPKLYRQTHKPNLQLLDAQIKLIDWLERERIIWADISGSAEAMIEHYAECDLHIGCRVHAHILMASLSRPTVLIAEDGRGIALRDVLGGIIFDGSIRRVLPGLLGKVAARLKYPGKSFLASPNLSNCIVEQINYELNYGFPRITTQRAAIDQHFEIMKKFLEGLP